MAFAYVYKMNRVAVVAMDDHGQTGATYPAAYGQGIIAVGATDNSDVRPSWSEAGSWIDVSAPGVNILSTYRNGVYFSDPNYEYLSGTSMATPYVSGIVSLLKGFNSNLYNDDIEHIIQLSADKIRPDLYTYDANGWNANVGFGRVNARKALNMLRAPLVFTRTSTTGGSDKGASSTYGMTIFGAQAWGLADGNYFVKRHEVRTTVSFPANSWRAVWGRGVASGGWSAENPNFSMGYCDVVPGTVTSTSAQLRTYVYEVYDINYKSLGWKPTTPGNVTFAYTKLEIPSTITANSTLDGNYVLDNDVTVNSGVTLTITPGSVISFANGKSLTINGVINAQGTSTNQIRFTSASGTIPGSWNKILILNNGNSILKYCTFEYGTNPLSLTNITTGNITIVENCTFKNNSQFGLYTQHSLVNVKSCQIFSNGLSGVGCYNNLDVKFTANHIYNNSGNGVDASSSNFLEFYGNVIESNTGHGFKTANSDHTHLGQPYTWSGYNTIRWNGLNEVEAETNNPSVEIATASIHDASGYEIYNYPGNPQIYTTDCYWDANGCQYSGSVSFNGSNNSLPSWDGQPRTAGSPLGKGSAPVIPDSIPWFYNPRIPDAEKVARCKDIIARNTLMEEAKTALVWLYIILRTDYTQDQLGERKGFYNYLQDIKTNCGDSEIGKLALRYMIFWKMLENENSTVIRLSQEALNAITGEDRKWVLVDLAHIYARSGRSQEAKSTLKELREKYTNDKESIVSIENGIADIEGQISNGSFNPDEKARLITSQALTNVVGIFQNYPNPFNPSTIISYQLSSMSHIKLSVYDVLGREVEILVDGMRDVGSYSTSFDGSKLSSGIYFTRIIVQPQEGLPIIQVKKMLLTK